MAASSEPGEFRKKLRTIAIFDLKDLAGPYIEEPLDELNPPREFEGVSGRAQAQRLGATWRIRCELACSLLHLVKDRIGVPEHDGSGLGHLDMMR
jgi:hypothetical protein